MAGTKRRSTGDDAEARPSKVAKGSKAKDTKGGPKKGKGKSKAVPFATFHSQALPIHVSLTHTPAAVIENEDEPTTSSDPGHITAVTLLPSEFTTGSYGWKGNSRIQVELQGAEGKEKEKVTVMLNINATVVGSKGAKNEAKGEGEIEEDAESDEEETKED